MRQSAARSFPLAVVTGAGHRLGKAIALGLARRGYAVGLHYHASAEAARLTAAEIEALGVPALLLPADLRDETAIEQMFHTVDASGFPLQVLVNSAAQMDRADLRTLSTGEWDSTLDLNLRAPWLCARHAAGRMDEGSLIVNITDAGTAKVWAAYPAYAVSKAALETLTRLLAKTLAPRVRVNAIAPGLILPAAGLPPEEWQRLVQRLPLKRSGDPANIVQAVVFLLENQYITGQTLVIDGGYQLVSV